MIPPITQQDKGANSGDICAGIYRASQRAFIGLHNDLHSNAHLWPHLWAVHTADYTAFHYG